MSRLSPVVPLILLVAGSVFSFQPDLRAQVNLALNQPAISSGPNWGSFTPAALTDGDPSTFVHPLLASGTFGFYYQVDLGHSYRIERIVLHNRDDGCCPERLSNYRVELYRDGGDVNGPLRWETTVRADGSNSEPGGTDVIDLTQSPLTPQSGRFVRVVNLSNMGYNPQIAEIEVFGGHLPLIAAFGADDDIVATGEGTMLRWEISDATSAEILPAVGPVNPAGGSVQVVPPSTTKYTLTASNETGPVTAEVTVAVGLVQGPPELTEFLADNSGGHKDEDGDSTDWIELQNPTAFGLRVGGFFLTDDPADLRKWPVPDAHVAANGFLLVFASGKDRRDPRAQLHANFKLDAQGDYLALVDRDGTTILRQFPANYPNPKTFPKQRANISYGIDSEGREGFFRLPTPGGTNGPAFAGIVGDTHFDHDRGFYDTNFVIAITSATADATIRYTTDRSLPTATRGAIYTEPIPITKTTILRAAAFKEGWAPTDVDTQTYIFPSNVITSAVMRKSITTNAVYQPQLHDALLDLPSVSLIASAAINDTTEVRTSFEWLRPDGQPGIHQDCGVRLYGGAFTDFSKKNFRLYFNRQFGPPKIKYPFFAGFEHGLAAVDEFDQLELRSGSHDMEMRGFYMSNICTDDTLLDMGQLNPHGRFVHLYLNGTYWGVYHLRERWGAGMHSRYLGGSSTNYESINGNWNVGGWPIGVPYDGDGSTWKRVKSLQNNYAAVKPWLDVPQYTDYMLMWMFGGSEDEYRCVGPNVPGSGFKFYLNDADGWFCVPTYCAAGDRTARSPTGGRQPGDGPGSLFSMLFKEGNPDHRVMLADRIYKAFFNGGALTTARNAARLTNRCNEVRRPFIAESARWGYLSPTAWATRRDSVVKSWLPARTAQALAQFRAAGFYPSVVAPVMGPQGGVVAAGSPIRFTGPTGGTIWYTLDGTDPRLPGGAISPTARTYNVGGSTETPVPTGSAWRWFTDATGLSASDVVEGSAAWSAADWKHPNFDDSSWSEGPAQLGYGEEDQITELPFGPDTLNKWVSSYFRHRFTLVDTAGITRGTLRIKRDDGAIVYLNGHEAARTSIAAGVIAGSTPGENASDDGQGFNELTLDVGLLRAGENVLAVEIHQARPDTSDLSFDLELGLTRTGAGGGAQLAADVNTLVKSRTRAGAQWSALNEAFFQVGPDALGSGDVVVSELNFNPQGDDGSEFVEVANISKRAVNLRGAHFSSGIDFTFPDNRDTLLAPGQRLVLANDLFRFQQRYGIDVPVAGIFAGNLSNGGERLTLTAAAGAEICSFQYDGAKPWPVDADGGGYTLVLAHPQLGLDNPAAWRSSSTTNGTPGAIDATLFIGEAMADADADGLPAIFEYALGTSDSDASKGPGAVTYELDDQDRFIITFPRNLRADDVLLTVEHSGDLSAWSPATLLSTRTADDGRAIETWGVAVADNDQQFLRLRVERLQ